MKKILTMVFAVAFSTGLFAGNGLVITQKYTDAASKSATVTVTWYVTPTQCKMKMSYADDKVNTTTTFVPDVTGGKLLTYSDGGVAPGGSDKKFYAVPVQSIKSGIDASRVNVSQTGETKTIGGMLCQRVIVKTNRSTTEMWITKDFKADFYKFYPFFQSSYELMGLNQESLQGVPLESVTRDLGGAVINSFQLVSAVNSDLGTGEFTVPGEYKGADAVTGK